MGARKRLRAEANKEAKKTKAFASLRNCPTSPRKMRLIVDNIRGIDVNKALGILKYTGNTSARTLEKLLMSAISNWQQKNEGVRLEDSRLFVKEISVDGGRVLKRLRPAPQGRGYRIRKRSNHVTILLGSINDNQKEN
ncbi:MAG: 50S ribosomal protein L22 [Bacteroidetes bacterium HGW-Bacteroidetes-21]|jgi:large subunit ribosomal protein L22|nr:MAG: 50S ribosomal protein L22 [Bacteroidetes bacterium HGW-Bacteroidetes-21]